MYLKGEGTEVNHTRAVELYEIAAKENHVRALNGLGFEYFSGHALPRNTVSCWVYRQAYGILGSMHKVFTSRATRAPVDRRVVTGGEKSRPTTWWEQYSANRP